MAKSAPIAVAAAPALAPRPKVYSYLVTPIGPVMRVQLGSEPTTLRFRGRLAKKDGWMREHDVVVTNSDAHPSLVDEVEAALANSPVRLLLSFERVTVPRDEKVRHIQTLARVEDIVAPAHDQRQLRLF